MSCETVTEIIYGYKIAIPDITTKIKTKSYGCECNKDNDRYCKICGIAFSEYYDIFREGKNKEIWNEEDERFLQYIGEFDIIEIYDMINEHDFIYIGKIITTIGKECEVKEIILPEIKELKEKLITELNFLKLGNCNFGLYQITTTQ